MFWTPWVVECISLKRIPSTHIGTVCVGSMCAGLAGFHLILEESPSLLGVLYVQSVISILLVKLEFNGNTNKVLTLASVKSNLNLILCKKALSETDKVSLAGIIIWATTHLVVLFVDRSVISAPKLLVSGAALLRPANEPVMSWAIAIIYLPAYLERHSLGQTLEHLLTLPL